MSAHSPRPYTPYRRFLAWLGFLTLYIAAPLLLAYILSISRAEANACSTPIAVTNAFALVTYTGVLPNADNTTII